MKRKFLEDMGLEKEAIDKIMDEHGAGITAAKADVQKLESERDDFKAQYETAEQTITTLKAAEAANETLQTTIKDHEATIAKLQTDSEALKKGYSLKEKLAGLGVSDPDYIIFKHGGVDKFNFDKNGELVGLEDTIKPYKESLPHIFATDEPVIKGAKPAESGSSEPGSGEQSPGAIYAQQFNAQFAPPTTN